MGISAWLWFLNSNPVFALNGRTASRLETFLSDPSATFREHEVD
jgi:hypothetical protein